MRFDSQPRTGTELLRIGWGELLAADGAEEAVELLSGHVRGFGLGGIVVSEGLPGAQRRLRRAAADAQCHSLVREQIEGGGLLGEVERFLIRQSVISLRIRAATMCWIARQRRCW